MADWIYLNDQKPPYNQMVLCHHVNGSMFVAELEPAIHGLPDRFRSILFQGEISLWNVTHWMPLPEEPKIL